MFQRIDLLHFKCFELLRLPLRPLTLLSGLNASGKSSVMQAFALFHQTVREHEWSPMLMLNGSAVRLGTAGDVIDQVSGSRDCGVGLRDGDKEYQWEFSAERSDMSLTVTRVALDGQQFTAPDGDFLWLHQLLPEGEVPGPALKRPSLVGADLAMRLDELSYLTAERTGPRDTYPLEGRDYLGVIGAREGLIKPGFRSPQWEFSAERSDMSLTVTEQRSVALDGQQFTAPAGDFLWRPSIASSPEGEVPGPALKRPSLVGADLAMRLDELSYLTAERTGPRDTYPLEGRDYLGVIGARGEHAVSLLYSRGDEPVVDGVALGGIPRTRLRQVGARMATFFPGCELEVSPIPRANSLTLGVRTSHQTDFHRPGHTGFGITQVLPIVVASLFAKPESMLLIENPEVHLHPSGQATMGEFLAEVAAAGVQVVLETHSDHVLSGVRRAVKRGVLKADAAALHFFRSREDAARDGGPQVQSPQLAADGSVDHWPEGFFDQFDKDMNHFAGWS